MANSRSGDPVVDRIARLISAFREDVTTLQLSELAARADLPPATAHRLVAQLAEHGLLETALGVVVPLREMSLQGLVPALQTAARGIARQLGEA